MIAFEESPVHLGRYTLHERLAAGGMAEVYLATCADFPDLQREVVIKRILPRFVDHPSFRQMFADEARLAARLQHRNIIQAYGFHDDPSGPYIVFEYVRGPSLADLMRAGISPGRPFPWAVALTIARDLAAGLHHAHELCDRDGTPLNIVHRDVSPGNVLLGLDGTVKVIDFGIAYAQGRQTRTASGVVKGKPGYMAPEQYLGDADRRADVYALGIIMYEMTTAAHLAPASTSSDLVRALSPVTPPSAHIPWYPVALEAIVLRALAQRPADRYATAAELMADVEAFAWTHGIPLSPIELATYTRAALTGARAEALASSVGDATVVDAAGGERTPPPASDAALARPMAARHLRVLRSEEPTMADVGRASEALTMLTPDLAAPSRAYEPPPRVVLSAPGGYAPRLDDTPRIVVRTALPPLVRRRAAMTVVAIVALGLGTLAAVWALLASG